MPKAVRSTILEQVSLKYEGVKTRIELTLKRLQRVPHASVQPAISRDAQVSIGGDFRACSRLRPSPFSSAWAELGNPDEHVRQTAVRRFKNLIASLHTSLSERTFLQDCMVKSRSGQNRRQKKKNGCESHFLRLLTKGWRIAVLMWRQCGKQIPILFLIFVLSFAG